MKKYLPLLLFFILTPTLLKSQEAVKPPKLLNSDIFQFPSQLVRVQNISEGTATVRFVLSPEGKILDYFTESASHVAFAEAVEEDFSRAEFRPAMENDEAIAIRQSLQIKLTQEGRNRAVSVLDDIMKEFAQSEESGKGFWLMSTSEIDTLPQLKETGKVYSVRDDAGNDLGGEVIVSFYIDRFGEVHMPEVVETADERLNNAALQTVKNFKFTAAKYDGKAVPVEIQRYKFIAQ